MAHLLTGGDAEQPAAVTGEDAPATSDGRDPKAILTAEERRKIYRARLENIQKGQFKRLKEFVLAKRKYLRHVDAEPRRLRLQEIDLMFRYFDGDMYGYYDAMGNYRDQKQDGDFAYTIPMLTGHVGQAFMTLLKTQPQYKLTPDDKDDPAMVRLAAMCEELATRDLKRTMQEDETQTEILNSILAGESYREIYWAPNPKSPRKVTRTKYERVRVELPARRECGSCSNDVPEGRAACACGSTFVKDIPAGQTFRDDPYDEEVEVGENCLRIPHPMAVQRDLSALRVEHSTYLVERDYFDKHVAEWKYQTVIQQSEEGLSPEMQTRHALERSTLQTDAVVGSARAFGQQALAGAGNKVERERIFLDPSEYGQFYCDVEETLPDGNTIPAGTIIGDKYTGGVYIEILGDEVIHFKPVQKLRRWVLVQYGKRPGSGTGSGAKMLMPLNDIVNDQYNLYHAVMSTSARPFTAVHRQAVSGLPEAGSFLFIDRLPPGVSDIGGAIKQFPGQSVAGMDSTASTIQSAMQFIFGTSTLGGGGMAGAPDMAAAGTATGIIAMEGQAAGRQAGPVGQRIAADKETLFIFLENRRDYSSPEQRKELERRYGKDIVALFFETNFRQVMTIDVAPNTDIPRSMGLLFAQQTAFAQIVAALAPVAEKVPWLGELIGSIAESVGMPFNVGPGRTDRRDAEYRLSLAARVEERLSKEKPELATDQRALAEAVYVELTRELFPLGAKNDDEEVDVPRLFMHDHQVFLDAYKDWLFGEKKQSASQALVMVVLRLWQDHFQAQLEGEIKMAQLQADMQADLNPQPPPPDPAAEAAAREQEAARALEQEAAAREADEAAAEAEHERKLELEEAKAGHKLTAEEARAAARREEGARA